MYIRKKERRKERKGKRRGERKRRVWYRDSQRWKESVREKEREKENASFIMRSLEQAPSSARQKVHAQLELTLIIKYKIKFIANINTRASV